MDMLCVKEHIQPSFAYFMIFFFLLFGQFVEKFRPNVLRKCGSEFQSLIGLSMLVLCCMLVKSLPVVIEGDLNL